MTALLWLFGIIFGFYALLYLFGGLIRTFLLRRLEKFAKEQMRQQSAQYEEAFRSGTFEKKVKPGPDADEIVIPHKEKKTESRSSLGENVDFEELN